MKHTLVALVENKPGVLNRVASLFRRRNFNIDSLTVGRTESPEVSRMTIVMEDDPEKVQNQLYKLVNVIQVDNVTHAPNVSRDLALIKVQVSAETRGQVIQICDIFRAHIVDTSPETLIVEVTGDEEKITGIVEMLRQFGILEMVRTGVVTMVRGEQALSPNGYHEHFASRGNGHSANVL